MARIDVLGEDFQATDIPLRADREGDVVATLVKHAKGPATRRAVLYVHGFADYFFHPHLATAWADLGFDFYAIDLRKYGRSLRDWQTPNFVTALDTYDEELSAAVRIIREQDGHSELVVMSHSTGGLITALWADRLAGTGTIQALVMNSPWFDLAGGWFERVVLTSVMRVVGAVAPSLIVGRLKEHYGHALHVSAKGEWNYDLRWKPFDAFPVRAGWIRGIRAGQARLQRGLSIDCPVLILTSDASGDGNTWSDAITTTDVVLDVKDMWRLAPRLGRDVDVVKIPGGMHDLALSPEPARSAFFTATAQWVRSRLLA